MGRHNLGRQRRRFFREHPYCYYCGCLLVLEPPTADNAATIDHLRPRWDSSRQEPNRFYLWRHVLACLKCNGALAAAWWARRSLEEKWRASGHWPRMAYQAGALPGEV